MDMVMLCTRPFYRDLAIQDFYSWVFGFLCEGEARNCALESAMESWPLLLKGKGVYVVNQCY